MNQHPHRLIRVRPDVGPERLALSPLLAETMARGVAESGQPALLIRHQSPYWLLGPKDRRLPRLRESVAWLHDQGLAVYHRLGGGSAVLLDGGCLSFAVARPCRDLTTWRANFVELAAGVIRGLARLGIPAAFGEAAEAYCPGPFDLLVDGVKVAGIAQAIRGGYALVSGMLLVHQDPEAATALVNEFYRRAGSPTAYSPRAVGRLDALVPGLALDTVEAALVAGYAETTALVERPFSAAEWALAAALRPERTATAAITPTA